MNSSVATSLKEVCLKILTKRRNTSGVISSSLVSTIQMEITLGKSLFGMNCSSTIAGENQARQLRILRIFLENEAFLQSERKESIRILTSPQSLPLTLSTHYCISGVSLPSSLAAATLLRVLCIWSTLLDIFIIIKCFHFGLQDDRFILKALECSYPNFLKRESSELGGFSPSILSFICLNSFMLSSAYFLGDVCSYHGFWFSMLCLCFLNTCRAFSVWISIQGSRVPIFSLPIASLLLYSRTDPYIHLSVPFKGELISEPLNSLVLRKCQDF